MNSLKEQLVLGILGAKFSQKGSVAFFKLTEIHPDRWFSTLEC